MPQILVVEDDDAIRGLVSEVLRDDGYDVREATNGVEALDRLREERPDLIVLDLMMPVMDGWAFVEACRRKQCCDDVVGVGGLRQIIHRAHFHRGHGGSDVAIAGQHDGARVGPLPL